ncbi:CDP-glycerol glycerophosphotransferase [Eubacterium uniforme]|uniref:CDP-glycerol glycerophosphotransferase n=1 Tax=Eubacterium uniforme TaxID=39495 RepID=A0A1T4VF64_9FIRM|nr:bifunctional glycosyltransferase family 2 protein/CDP-glycerol:glycerophosphate glycerophosphotransferase [Eubacterium uniforme]SKA63161.1 CDP-glycerol glycerophosphotransferase [Eubacterium uniforme]
MISIIIPHKKGVPYLKDALDSIKDLTYKDYETILVIDHSEDDLEEVINKYKDIINLRVFYLDDKEGCASARNLGLDEAKGEYVFFLDSDDYFFGDYLGKMVALMDDNTDIVYSDFKRTWFRRGVYKESQANYDEKKKEAITLRKVQKEFEFTDVKDFMINRNKRMETVSVLGCLYRKSLFIDNNIRFDDDLHFFIDAAVFMKLYTKAKGIRPCEGTTYIKRYHNDKETNMAIMQHSKIETMPHYFKSYKAAVDVVKADLEKHYDLKLHLNLILCIFVVNEYIRYIRWSPDKEWKNEYYNELKSLMADVDMKVLKMWDFTPGEKKLLKKFATCDFKYIQSKSKRILAVRKIRKFRSNRRIFFRTVSLHIFSKLSMKNDWVCFESFLGRNYSGQPKYIYKYMLENCGNKYKYIWFVDNKNVKVTDGKCKVVKRFSLKYYYYMNRSKYLVLNMRQPKTVPIRDEMIICATWHGTPLKRLGFDMEDVHSATANHKSFVKTNSARWNYMLSDNPFSTEKFQSAFLVKRSQILESGYPANDIMYYDNKDEIAADLREKLGIPKDKKTILYAPTWRDDDYTEGGHYNFKLALDLDRLKKEFGDEYVVLLRMHYYIIDSIDLSSLSDFAIDVSSYSDISELYLISDMIITDYSSVFFDYANLRRPVIFYTYDYEKYKDVLHGFYLDMHKDLPGPILMTEDEVIDAIRNIDKVNEEYKERYDEFCERFCCLDDGHASQRVVETVFKD